MITLALTSAHEVPPGCYRLDRTDRRDTITIGCPHCEGEFVLAKHFMVGRGGVLNPVLLCPLYGCGRKYPATLAKWRARR